MHQKIKILTLTIKSTYQWQRLTSLTDAISQILPNKNHCLYSVSFASSGNTFLFKNTRASKQGTFDMNDISNLEEEIVDTDNNNFFKDNKSNESTIYRNS